MEFQELKVKIQHRIRVPRAQKHVKHAFLRPKLALQVQIPAIPGNFGF